MPHQRRLLGLWMLACGALLFGGAFLALWLDARLTPDTLARAWLWLVALAPGTFGVALGWWLSHYLLTPLRHLRVQLSRLVANPQAQEAYLPEGWLRDMDGDLQRLRDGWRQDREALATAHADGARNAARIRQELETLVQSLQVPLILCDGHRRILLFNHAAEQLFKEAATPLGLGRQLQTVFSAPSLHYAWRVLSSTHEQHEVLVPLGNRWLRVTLRRVESRHGEVLMTLQDATASWLREVKDYSDLHGVLGTLRTHCANLQTGLAALEQATADRAIRHRLEQATRRDAETIGKEVSRLGELMEHLTAQSERLGPIWSNDFWHSLAARLGDRPALVPIGLPAWFQGDVPALLPMIQALCENLADFADTSALEAEACLGNRRVYLDLIWRGQPLSQGTLATWCETSLEELPLAPRIGDLLRQHDSDLWSLADADGLHARLRLPLQAIPRVGSPSPPPPPRPEFHDFDIANLPDPTQTLAHRALHQLELVVFDTETTGLELANGDTVVSLGACRVVNGRLLADDCYDQCVDPQRPIPAQSTRFHGLTDDDVRGAPTLRQVLPRFRDYVGDAVLLAHNAAFDMQAIHPLGSSVRFDNPVLDTLLLSRALDTTLDDHDLDALVERYALTIPPGARHTALGDARVTAVLWLGMLPRLEARGIVTLGDALKFQKRSGVNA
ncbi:3'-5' exonuclease [Modicisalibacter xianhensis]|uniref:DNA-directed DNA polymerase n=1 Tax=Modicisalibacter xianhensis TaxID=442341 RepID=A0A1I3AD89_9GAMM|nr:exonuclease domain-containing protein [Halomonas xianhensis]SFH47776.1 DNA polymerase-3 subunit epsilon [Halomonas xianhensis]